MSPGSSEWSEPVAGLSGRLRAEFENLHPGLRHAVYLELWNHLAVPVAVVDQPDIRADLYDVRGEPVGATSFPASGPVPAAQWAVLPGGAYLGFRVDTRTMGVPTTEHGTALLAVGGASWAVGAGRYELRATVLFPRKDGAPADQWTGELEPPPVEIVLTPRMLAAD